MDFSPYKGTDMPHRWLWFLMLTKQIDSHTELQI
jgi:hypothetical protein